MQNEMSFDFDGLIQLLAGHLYSEKKVFIRELIQNAHDAIQRRVFADPEFELNRGQIGIETDLSAVPGHIVFRDNGIGMTKSDLIDFLSTIGRSGTKAARESAHEELAGVIGQFGIGFLSGFVVGKRVVVRTRHYSVPESEGCIWENEGRAEYSVETADVSFVGTEVTIYLDSAEDRGLLHDDFIKKVVRQYADMLRIGIHLNDKDYSKSPINTKAMPWERTGISDEEMRLDAKVYLEKTVPDSVLEVVPVKIDEPETKEQPALFAEGLLYITRVRVFGRDTPRTVRVFLKRMFLCEDAKELLPPWATFVNGIINTSSLSPNAARDNFSRDDSFERLRERLGQIIVQHFEQLEPQRLTDILSYHDLAIKSACHYYDPFFERFGHLLEWRINSKAPAAASGSEGRRRNIDAGANYAWARLPDILASLPQPDSGSQKRLTCFTSRSSANQYFEMADAAGTTVLDASYNFEEELLKTWAENNRDRVRLVYVDREDDPAVFRNAQGDTDAHIVQLARLMATIRPGGSGRLQVEAKRFEPSTLPAVLKSSEVNSGAIKANEILNDPNASSELRAMAEEMQRLRRNDDMRMNINAANPLIRTLATLIVENPEDEDLRDLMRGVYNDAILYNQEMMTPRSAQIFHEQFQRLMKRSLEFIKQRSELAEERKNLELQRVSLAMPESEQTREHLVAFLMTPFSEEFEQARSAVRIAVEVELGCELRMASDKTFADVIRSSVQAHMNDADFFIADITGANPNVMMELGAAYASPTAAPVLLIARVTSENSKPDLPADLEGHIAVTYVSTESTEATSLRLLDGFQKNSRLEALLKTSDAKRFVSSKTLVAWTEELLKDNSSYERLSSAFATVDAWRSVSAKQLEPLLGDEKDLATAVLARVKKRLPAGME